GRLLHESESRDWGAVLQRLVARSGETLLRQAVTSSIRILARQFVMGRTMDEALARARPAEERGYRRCRLPPSNSRAHRQRSSLLPCRRYRARPISSSSCW
ncbi:MAG: hypothetical protein ACLQKK_18020, partial [Rhodomicrobium sp.]